MREAHHSRWAHCIFNVYLRNLIKRTFHSIRILGECPMLPEDKSVLLLPNHSSWWDGFIIYWINELRWNKTPFVMMEEKQLNRFSFFNRVGAYSIRPGNREDVEKALKYTARLLENPHNLVFLFPQGRLLPWHQRPLTFKSGYKQILSITTENPSLFLCGIRPEYMGERCAEVFLMFRELPASTQSTEQAALIMEDLLREMETQISQGEKGILLFSGKKSPGA